MTPHVPRPTKPRCRLSGTDGNVFALASRVSAALRKAKQDAQEQELRTRLFKCHSYAEALELFAEYVDIT